jgi:Mrp family chromosome partitioning ATPase
MKNPSTVSYAWIAARSRNAIRRPGLMGIAGGTAFIAALIAFVLVPGKRADRIIPAEKVEVRPDSASVVVVRDEAAAQVALADSVLAIARRSVAAPAAAPIDTFPPEMIARRDSITNVVAILSRLITRAETSPLSSSYRALAESPYVADIPQVKVLLDSLGEIEKEREAFGAVGAVDPVYVALTARATAIGRGIQGLADRRRGELRAQISLLRPTAPVATVTSTVDTMLYVTRRAESEKIRFGAEQELAAIRQKNAKIDQQLERMRNVANVDAPPLAMLGAAAILALAVGFAVAFGYELRRPHIADSREAEQFARSRVITVVKPSEVVERARRRSDEHAPPLIDVVSENYKNLYLNIAGSEVPVPVITVTGEEPVIVAAVAANLAAAAAYEARSTLLVDVDPTTSTIAGVLRLRANPGFADVMAGSVQWAEAIVPTTIGRDRPLDVLPSGTGRVVHPDGPTVTAVRGGFERMQRRYDFIVIAAPISFVVRDALSIIPGPDVVLCGHISRTKTTDFATAAESLRGINAQVHGLVLWDDELPRIETAEVRDEAVSTRANLSFAGENS